MYTPRFDSLNVISNMFEAACDNVLCAGHCALLDQQLLPYEPRHEKTRFLSMRKKKAQISFAVTAKLISVFVFATRIVQFLIFLNPKFQASSLLL